MTSTLLKYNVILKVLCIGMTLIHISSQADGVAFGEYLCTCQNIISTSYIIIKNKNNGTSVLKTCTTTTEQTDKDGRLKEGMWNLYYVPGNSACRSVLMTAKALNFEMNLIPMDLVSHDQLKPEFLAINPQHTLPTLVKDEFVLWESRAIMVYLVEAFGKENDPLFPKDTKKRAIINQRLQFDMGTLYQAFIDQYINWFFGYSKKTEKKEKLLQQAIGFLETFLKNSDWVAGDSMTLADISLVSSISTFEVSGVDLKKYENVSKWLQRCKDQMVGYKEINQVGLERFKTIVVDKIKKTGPQTDLVTKEEVVTATEVLRNAVKAKIIGEEFSDSINKINQAVN